MMKQGEPSLSLSLSHTHTLSYKPKQMTPVISMCALFLGILYNILSLSFSLSLPLPSLSLSHLENRLNHLRIIIFIFDAFGGQLCQKKVKDFFIVPFVFTIFIFLNEPNELQSSSQPNPWIAFFLA